MMAAWHRDVSHQTPTRGHAQDSPTRAQSLSRTKRAWKTASFQPSLEAKKIVLCISKLSKFLLRLSRSLSALCRHHEIRPRQHANGHEYHVGSTYSCFSGRGLHDDPSSPQALPMADYGFGWTRRRDSIQIPRLVPNIAVDASARLKGACTRSARSREIMLICGVPDRRFKSMVAHGFVSGYALSSSLLPLPLLRS